MILGIDTSAGTSVAVVDPEGTPRAVADSVDRFAHAEVIGDLLRDALAAAGSEVTHVAVGMGPGPFTGLRIGIAAARAFAMARGIPVVPVVSHDAVAWRVDPGGRFAVVTDARRRDVAFSVYHGLDGDGIPVRLEGPALAPAADVDARLAQFAAARRDAAAVDAGAVAALAARALAAGRVVGPGEPIYLRPPDVTVAHARKRVLS